MDSPEYDVAMEQPKSLLGPFCVEHFAGHRGWTGLKQILETSAAGSYGLSGPRGAGKTWLMERAIKQAEENGGLGVWFPSPSEYEPTAFLAALSGFVATRFEEFYDESTDRPTRVGRSRFLRFYIPGVSLAYIGVGLLVLTNLNGSGGALPAFFNLANSLLALVVLTGVGLSGYAFMRRRGDSGGLQRARDEAEELRRQVRYTATATESDELDLGVRHAGVGGLLRRARQRQLVERPATLSSLIHNFRAFSQAAAKEVPGPVVIAVDELDKMSDSTRVAQLLRDIKGIFEIRGVCFLVSISDEAARALDLGAVRGRDEFNSSFYTVITVPPFSPAACLDLLRLRDRGFADECGLAIGVLTGGVSRELVRVAELVRLGAGAAPSLSQTVVAAMTEEVEAFNARVLQGAGARGGSGVLGDQARVELFDSAQEARQELREDGQALSTRLACAWDLNGDNLFWMEQFAEEWRRLLVRLGVAGAMLADSEAIRDPTRAEALQRIVIASAASAAVGRRMLESGKVG